MINAFRHQRFLHKFFLLWTPSLRLSDQRLSASKIFAQARLESQAGKPRVINAFRHQRFLHELTGQEVGELQCDQRLSASKIFARARV